MASPKRVLTPRGAPAMMPSRAAFLSKLPKNDQKEQCDSGFQEDSFRSQGSYSFERDSSEVRCIEEATKNLRINDPAGEFDRHPDPCTTTVAGSHTTSLPARTELEVIAPRNCFLDYAQCNDVRYLLAPMRNYLFVQDEDGDTPLHLAIIHMQQQVIEAFVSVAPTSQFLDIFNLLRQTPLHLATITKQSSVVKYLLAAGASVDLVDRNGKTALHLACEHGDMECIREITRPLLDKTCSEEARERVCNMLEMRDYAGFTSLQYGVFANHVSVVGFLTNIGANVNMQDGTSGKTALHHAVEAENLSMASYLLFQCKAEVDALSFDECAPLHIAAGRGMISMTGLLLAAGADPSINNSSGESPHDHAADNVCAMLEPPPLF